jgi:hypothetical protein
VELKRANGHLGLDRNDVQGRVTIQNEGPVTPGYQNLQNLAGYRIICLLDVKEDGPTECRSCLSLQPTDLIASRSDIDSPMTVTTQSGGKWGARQVGKTKTAENLESPHHFPFHSFFQFWAQS